MTRIANRQIPDHIATLTPFAANSTRGDFVSGYVTTGILPAEWADALRSDIANRIDRAFVVYSYATPIAWWTDTAGWVIPEVRYSVTTSRAQGFVRRGAGGLFARRLPEPGSAWAVQIAANRRAVSA